MAPLVNRLFGAVRPDTHRIGTCLVCNEVIDAADESVRLHGGGHVHADCATYRMRHRRRAARRRPVVAARPRYTGD